jgi:amino acid transporter
MKEKFKIIKTMHLFLVAGLAIAYFLIGDLESMNFLEYKEIAASNFIYIVVPIIAIILGNYLYKDQLKNVDKRLKLAEKIGTYQTASLIRWAIIEGAAFFILFYNTEFVLIGMLLILYMLFLKPSEQKMKLDFQKFEN